MSELARIQRAFAEALDGHEIPLGEFKEPQGMPLHLRFDVYRNNVFGAVSRSMEGLYPAFLKLVGPEFFNQCIRDFLAAHPPYTGDLLNYGYDFGTFLQAYPPCASYLYLADVAALEAAWQKAYMAEEAPTLDSQRLAAVSPDDMVELRFLLHPSCQFLDVNTPASQIWEAALNDADDIRIDPKAGGEHLLIIRTDTEVEVRRLSREAFAFLMSLNGGETLGTAYASAMAQNPNFDLQMTLADLLEGKSFADFSLGGIPK